MKNYSALVGVTLLLCGAVQTPVQDASAGLGPRLCEWALIAVVVSPGAINIGAIPFGVAKMRAEARERESTEQLREVILNEWNWSILPGARSDGERDRRLLSDLSLQFLGDTLLQILSDGDYLTYAMMTDPETLLAHAEFEEMTGPLATSGDPQPYTLRVGPREKAVDVSEYLLGESETPRLSRFVDREPLTFLFGTPESSLVEVEIEVLSFWDHGGGRTYQGSYFQITDMGYVESP